MSVHPLFPKLEAAAALTPLTAAERFMRDAYGLLGRQLTIDRKSPTELLEMADQIELILPRYAEELSTATGDLLVRLMAIGGDLANRALTYRAGAAEKSK